MTSSATSSRRCTPCHVVGACCSLRTSWLDIEGVTNDTTIPLGGYRPFLWYRDCKYASAIQPVYRGAECAQLF